MQFQITDIEFDFTGCLETHGSYELPEECSCKGAGCAKCQLKITLKTGKRGIVLASDAHSKDPKCKFAYPDMPIVKLLAKQKLELEATAVLGQGKNHAKWSPGLVFYKQEPSIKFDDKKLKDEDKQFLNRLDKNVQSSNQVCILA